MPRERGNQQKLWKALSLAVFVVVSSIVRVLRRTAIENQQLHATFSVIEPRNPLVAEGRNNVYAGSTAELPRRIIFGTPVPGR